jgi:hypothetical protein
VGRPGDLLTPAVAAPNAASAGSALALVLTDGTDGTINGSRWYAWNESSKTLGALIGSAGSIASDTESVTRPNFFFGNSGSTLDCVVILPMDALGLNPQRSAGLNADGGVILQNWNRVRIYSGEFDVRTDFVRQSNGIGLNLLDTSTTTTAVAGAGYHDERMRALRIRNYNSVHIEGVKFGGANLYEAIDVSHGNSASSVLQIQRCQFGETGERVKNLRSFSNFYTANDGAVRQSLFPTSDHSGGDCLQTWTGPVGTIRVADCEFHTNFQALFLAWNDQSGAALAPSLIDIRRNEIHSYVSGPWLYYDTKVTSPAATVPPANFEDNFIQTHGYTATLGSLVHAGAVNGTTGTVSGGTYASRVYADWVGSALPAGSAHSGAQAFREGVPLIRVGPSGSTASGRVGALYNPSLWTTYSVSGSSTSAGGSGYNLSGYNTDGYNV